jgi:hypothetical protein
MDWRLRKVVSFVFMSVLDGLLNHLFLLTKDFRS